MRKPLNMLKLQVGDKVYYQENRSKLFHSYVVTKLEGAEVGVNWYGIDGHYTSSSTHDKIGLEGDIYRRKAKIVRKSLVAKAFL